MNISIITAIAFMLLGNAVMCQAGAPQEAAERDGNEVMIESYLKAIEASNNNEEKAQLYKKLGDLYVSREDYKNAAEEYIRAMFLKKDFPEQDRLRMAVSISWGDRLEEAIAEFRALLEENPNSTEARIDLARTLSWAGKYDYSLTEIDTVLGQSPDNKDALLIKANDLRWKGEIDEAFPIYRSILAKQEDFDTRLGYTYVLIERGDEAAAQESMALLKPIYPYQENELRRLKEKVSKPKPSQQSQGDAKFTHYRDTDGNDVNKYSASFGFPAWNAKALFSYVHTEAHDYTTRRNGSDMVSGETQVPLNRQLGLGIGLGIIRYLNDDASDFLLGHLKADVELPRGSAGVALASEPLNETAELIEKRIRFTAARAYLSRSFAGRFSLYGRYGYANYSDANNSHDLMLSLRYTLIREKPRTNIGYRFRYLDFNRQSFGGYFDPNRFLSHQAFINTSFESERYFGFAELFVGQQSFMRYGAGHNDIIYGGAGNIGYKLTKIISVEANAEGGNYALQTATGFKSFLYGLRLSGVW